MPFQASGAMDGSNCRKAAEVPLLSAAMAWRCGPRLALREVGAVWEALPTPQCQVA